VVEEIIHKTHEIQAIIARISKVRFDETREPQDVSRTIKNLVAEMKRLESDLSSLKKRQLSELESTLKLTDIGLPEHLLSEPRSPMLAGSSSHVTSSTDRKHSLDDVDTLTEEEQQNLKLMRTDSTGTLEGQPAKNKWQSLFKMFQEWKRETSIAQGQYALRSDSATVIDQEITKVRAAIVSLQHKKTLPPSEQELLSNLQHRLQQLMKAQRTMAND
jgi:hypothetical protein